jgi:hypothetical protein
VPPVADMGLEYAVFTVPEGSVALIVKAEAFWAAATASDRVTDLVCTGLDESVTLKVKLLVPLAVGVPEIRPVVEDSVSPAGMLADMRDHV